MTLPPTGHQPDTEEPAAPKPPLKFRAKTKRPPPKVVILRRRAPKKILDLGTPDPLRFAHDKIVEEPRVETDAKGQVRGRKRGHRVTTQTPLDRYRAYDNISQDQWWAGDRLRADYENSKFSSLAQGRYDPQPGGGRSDIAEISLNALEARKRYIAAIRCLPMRLSPIVIHVCCMRLFAADWAIAKHFPKTDGMALLRLGLDILADHYGRPPAVRSPDTSSPTALGNPPVDSRKKR